MNLPSLSHLQFLVVGVVKAGSLPGREVRDRLRSFGVRRSGPAFYQMMSRLEDRGLVEGTYHQEVIAGQIIRERHYSVTGAGLEAWEASRSFYMRAVTDLGGIEGLARA